MEKPIYNYLDNKNLNFPFCICWACENWSKLWDGGNKDILVESNLMADDTEQFWTDLLPFIKDTRYIRINNKPVIVMYRPNKFNSEILKSFIKELRLKAKNDGFRDLYIIWAITNDLTTKINYVPPYKEFGFDAIAEFPPHGIRDNANISKNVPRINIEGYTKPGFNGIVYDIKKYINDGQYKIPVFENVNIYRGIFPMWDNSARKAQTGCLIFDGTSPELYQKWLSDIVKWTIKNRPEQERYIFINAWNEWAEGAHLEPDSKHGYAYLEKTYEVISNNGK